MVWPAADHRAEFFSPRGSHRREDWRRFVDLEDGVRRQPALADGGWAADALREEGIHFT